MSVASKLGLVLFVCLPLLIGSTASAELLIDDFVVPNPEKVIIINWNDPNPFLLETADPGILGGERDLFVDVTGSVGPVSFSGQIGTDNFGVNQFVFNTGQAAYAVLQYDGVDVDTAGPPASLVSSTMSPTEDLVTDPLGGIDHNVFAFVFDRTSAGGYDYFHIGIEVHSSDGNTSTYTGWVPKSPGGFEHSVMFDDLDTGDGIGWDKPYLTAGAADFKNVDRVTFDFNNGSGPVRPNTDFLLRELKVKLIPEPSTLALLGLTAACMGLVLRRRRK